MAKRKRMFAVVIAIAIVFALSFSALFVITETNHNCMTGNCCRICQQINTCLEQLNNVATSSNHILFSSIFLFALVVIVAIDKNVSGTDTLIELKVKLSN